MSTDMFAALWLLKHRLEDITAFFLAPDVCLQLQNPPVTAKCPGPALEAPETLILLINRVIPRVTKQGITDQVGSERHGCLLVVTPHSSVRTCESCISQQLSHMQITIHS